MASTSGAAAAGGKDIARTAPRGPVLVASWAGAR